MRLIFKSLSDGERKRWQRLKLMSECVESISLIESSNFNDDTKEILELTQRTRHNTYHYWNAEKILREGFRDFFFNMENPGNKHAYDVDEKMLQLIDHCTLTLPQKLD